jgi:bacillithiol biosynthesis cysteine-adding enzyme BshC
VAADLFQAHVTGRASALFGHDPSSARDRRAAVERAARRPIAEDTRSCLAAQNARYGASAARAASLAALAAGAPVVVTGQQVGLFLGPLYTLYKAATAIVAARALAAESGRAVVPMFWLQTEDHDLPEIASCSVPRAHDEPLTLALDVPADNHVSIAHLRLPAAISGCVAALCAELEHMTFAREHLARLARCYRPGAYWAEAFATLLAELFEPEGLLLIDPRDPGFAPVAREVHRIALERAPQLEAAMRAQNARIEAAGYAPNVHVRERSPLCFFHAGGPEGPRARLTHQGDAYVEVGSERVHARAAVAAKLDEAPLCFSTSALLRPVLQDRLLPTAAYIGGPSEVAYFAQLPPLYAAFGLEPPLVLPRARFRLLEQSTQRALARLGLRAEQLRASDDALLAQLTAAMPDGAGPERLLRDLRDGFERVLSSELAELPEPVRAKLAREAEKTRKQLDKTSRRLAARYTRTRIDEQGALRRDLVRLKQALFPGGAPQERVYGMSYYAARFGERPLIELILRSIEPFSGAEKELAL